MSKKRRDKPENRPIENAVGIEAGGIMRIFGVTSIAELQKVMIEAGHIEDRVKRIVEKFAVKAKVG